MIGTRREFHANSCVGPTNEKIVMMKFLGLSALLLSLTLASESTWAQDIPGLEICTAEKTMERRTSCLQSNVDFLQKSMTKSSADQQQKFDAAMRQVQALKAALIAQQATIDELKSAQAKFAEELKKKPDAPPAKDTAPASSGK